MIKWKENNVANLLDLLLLAKNEHHGPKLRHKVTEAAPWETEVDLISRRRNPSLGSFDRTVHCFRPVKVVTIVVGLNYQELPFRARIWSSQQVVEANFMPPMSYLLFEKICSWTRSLWYEGEDNTVHYSTRENAVWAFRRCQISFDKIRILWANFEYISFNFLGNFVRNLI